MHLVWSQNKSYLSSYFDPLTFDNALFSYKNAQKVQKLIPFFIWKGEETGLDFGIALNSRMVEFFP